MVCLKKNLNAPRPCCIDQPGKSIDQPGKSIDQPGKVANLACGQLNRENKRV